jgi:hypothetical protein
MKRAFQVGAASIAEKLASGFSRGPYDSMTDLYTAAIATIMGYEVLTSPTQLKDYRKMGCQASDLATWVESVGANTSRRAG